MRSWIIGNDAGACRCIFAAVRLPLSSLPCLVASATRLYSHGSGDPHMATNVSIDSHLIEHALEVSGERTKKAAVTKA